MQQLYSNPPTPEQQIAAAVPPRLPSAEAQRAWNRSCSEAVARQAVRFAVAPQCSVMNLVGRRLDAGDEVVPEVDFSRYQVALLEQRGIVLHASDTDMLAASCPPDARYRVAPGQAVVARGTIFAAGAQLLPEHFDQGEFRIQELVRVGVAEDRDPQPVPQSPATAAVTLRTAELEPASAKVLDAEVAYGATGDARSEAALLKAKESEGLAGVRLDQAKKAQAATEQAERDAYLARRRRELAALEQELQAMSAQAKELSTAEVAATLALARAIGASYRHADNMFQAQGRWNAIYAESHGIDASEVRNALPVRANLHMRLQQLGRLASVDLDALVSVAKEIQ